MMRMEDTHPDITEYFEKGMISIRRTSKPFSRIPIDLTVEKLPMPMQLKVDLYAR